MECSKSCPKPAAINSVAPKNDGLPAPYFFFPCAATASMAAFTFSGSPR
jgi:hypothetical protein